MSIKEMAYQAHAYLEARGVSSIKRSHIHELLAAATGYKTLAAFQHDAIWCDAPFRATGTRPSENLLRARCLELRVPTDDIPKVTKALPDFLLESGYAPLRFEALIDAVDGQGYPDEDESSPLEWVWNYLCRIANEEQPILRSGLEAAAIRGVTSAHLAIAKFLEDEAEFYGDEQARLRRQVKREGTWTVAYVSFSDIDAAPLRVEEKYRYHLFAAARDGDIRALTQAAERYGNPAILERDPDESMDPTSMAEFAAEHGDMAKLKYWLTISAEEGDIHAMQELISTHEQTPEQAWVWMHLSRLLGHDLSKNHYFAINDDGSLWDEDIGGPAHVGGEGGIHLPPLSENADVIAYRIATELRDRIRE